MCALSNIYYRQLDPSMMGRGKMQVPRCSDSIPSCNEEYSVGSCSTRRRNETRTQKSRQRLRFYDEKTDGFAGDSVRVDLYVIELPPQDTLSDLYYTRKEIERMEVQARFAGIEFSMVAENSHVRGELQKSDDFLISSLLNEDDNVIEETLVRVARSDMDVRGLEHMFLSRFFDRASRSTHVDGVLAAQQRLKGRPSAHPEKTASQLAAQSLASSRRARMLARILGRVDELVMRNSTQGDSSS